MKTLKKINLKDVSSKLLSDDEMKHVMGGSGGSNGYLYCKFWMDGAGPLEGYCGTSSTENGCCNDLIKTYGSGYHGFKCDCY